MIVTEFSLFWLVFGVYYFITIVLDLIIVIFIVLVGRITRQNASIHSKTATLEGTETMLMTPKPTCYLRHNLEQLCS